jgi:hypothetical protein
MRMPMSSHLRLTVVVRDKNQNGIPECVPIKLLQLIVNTLIHYPGQREQTIDWLEKVLMLCANVRYKLDQRAGA